MKPRYYQTEAVQSFFQYIDYNPGKHPLIVLPTGGGKSYLMALIIQKMLGWDDTRVLVLAHRKELIRQNAQELTGLLDNIFYDVGIYSAGLNKRDTKNRVLFAGIQSVHNKAYELGFFDMILVDEAHRISIKSEGMYRQFLKDMAEINPKVVIGGLTATAYRLKGGMLIDEAHKDRIFDDICYEVGIKELMDANDHRNKDKKQYLCPIISPSKAMQTKVDLSKVKIQAGDYVQSQMQDAFCTNGLVNEAVNEIISYTHDRNKVLLFTAGIRHCKEVAENLKMKGCSVAVVHSEQSKEENEKALEDFRDGKVKYLCNVDVLTEGYNQKDIDCIVILRATQSVGLYIQITGRGFRLHSSKENCLVLDFGGNILRHGPVDKIQIKKHREGSGNSIHTSPQKECPKCTSVLSIQALTCPDCGFEFPLPERHEEKASEADILSKWKPPVTFQVSDITYSRHQKEGKPDSMRVDYFISLYEKYSEYICLNHDGFAKKKAEQWIKRRTGERIDTVDEALANCEKLLKPKEIIVNKNEKFPRIVSYIFESAEEIAEREKREREEKEMKETEALSNLIW